MEGKVVLFYYEGAKAVGRITQFIEDKNIAWIYAPAQSATSGRAGTFYRTIDEIEIIKGEL